MMLLKKKHMKGLRKKVLKLEYEQTLLFLNKKPLLSNEESKVEPTHKKAPSEQANFRILLLRNAPIDETLVKGVSPSPVIKGDTIELVKDNPQLTTHILGKCVKKNILKKLVRADCKYIYWIQPEARSLKEQLLHLNILKAYIRAEPKEAFLGCLLESRFDQSVKSGSVATSATPPGDGVGFSNYKYYYPSQILSLCDSIDRLGGVATSTGLEVIGQLLQTIEMTSAAFMSSTSMLLALKNEGVSSTSALLKTTSSSTSDVS